MDKIAIKLIETDSKMIESLGAKVGDFYHLPFWYKKISEGVYEEYRYEDLPHWVRSDIEAMRENKPDDDYDKLGIPFNLM